MRTQGPAKPGGELSRETEFAATLIVLQDCEEINVSCLSPTICGILLWWPKQTDTFRKVSVQIFGPLLIGLFMFLLLSLKISLYIWDPNHLPDNVFC